jgi:hypothetical protein
MTRHYYDYRYTVAISNILIKIDTLFYKTLPVPVFNKLAKYLKKLHPSTQLHTDNIKLSTRVVDPD